jgi:hypothetical protein
MANLASMQKQCLGMGQPFAAWLYATGIDFLLCVRRRGLKIPSWLHRKTGLRCFDVSHHQLEQDCVDGLMLEYAKKKAKKYKPGIVFTRPLLRKMHWILTERDLSQLSISQIMYRSERAGLGLKSTADLPEIYQTPQFISLFLRSLEYDQPGNFPIIVEDKWYWHPEVFKWLWINQIAPKKRINAEYCDREILTWLLNRIAPRRAEDTDSFHGGSESTRGISRGVFVAQWFDIHSFDGDAKEHYMTHVVDDLPNTEIWLNALLAGVEKYPNYCADKLDALTGDYRQRAIAHCNENKVRFKLAESEDQSKSLLSLVSKGLNVDLLDPMELPLRNHSHFVDLNFNLERLYQYGRAYLNHLSVLIENGVDDDELADIERYFLKNPEDIDKLDKRHVTEAIAKARLDHERSPAIARIYEGRFPAIWVHFATHHKKTISKLVITPQLTRVILESLDKDPDFPSTYIPKNIPRALATAQKKQAKGKGNYLELAGLRRCGIKAVLACARTTADFTFINEFIADKSGDRHVELYPDALKEQILCEELGL